MEINYFSSDEVNLFKRWYKLILLFSLSLIYPNLAKAQTHIKYEIEAQLIGTTNGIVPFWMRSNQYGSIPLSGVSQSVVARASKDYSHADTNQRKSKLLDWGFGIEARGNAGKALNGQLIEAYGKGRLGVFQLQVGRTKDVMGLNGDTLLSSGNFAVSGNALGIPKIELSIYKYLRIPIFDGLFSFKGNFAHGFLGKKKILDSFTVTSLKKITYIINNSKPESYFHQKSLYVRIGKKDWRINFYGGFNHQVYWGNESAAYGPSFKLSPLKSFFYVATGKAYGAAGVPTSKIGNQLGSIDFGSEYTFNNLSVMVYRQSFYDVGALSKLANIKDGLTGISFANRKQHSDNQPFFWKKILFELFYSKDQAGYPWSTFTKSGDEDYYNNFYYIEGWSYNQIGVGNPLITTKSDAKVGQAISKYDYFVNNRVIAAHIGLQFNIRDINLLTKLTYSKNYGTFGTSIYGNSTGAIRSPQTTNIFQTVSQFSSFLEANKDFKKGLNLGIVAALDQGNLLNNSQALLIKLKKSLNR